MAPTAVVVGAGVAGLSAAVALRRHSWDVEVVDERPRSQANTGSGLILWPNAQRALSALGVRQPPAPAIGLTLLDSSGTEMAAATAAGLHARLGGWPKLVLRGALMQDLERAAVAVGAGFAYGQQLTALAREGDHWLLRLGHVHAPVRADVVLGCDGIRSAVRRFLSSERSARPRFRHRTAYRGLSITPVPPAALTEVWGPQGRFGYAPLPDGRTYWFVDVPSNRPGARLGLPSLRDRFSSWCDPIPQILRGADPASLSGVDVHDLPLLPPWPHAEAALLGDAWHAMTPDLGQGACQALEDAAVLDQHLRQHPGAPDLHRFMRTRRARTAAAVLASRAAGAVAQPLPHVAARARASALKALPSRLVMFPTTAFARHR